MFDKNIIARACIATVFFVAPFVARAQIEVTEIAWMGTAVSANDEWVELHNSGSESVSLLGWTLSAGDGTPSISLSGSIGAGEYKLLERTDDTTFPGVTALVIFTGALGNEGENLSLKQGSTVIQALDFSAGWPAGDVATKKTMQWTGTAWVTADETAGAATTATSDETDDTTDDDTTEQVDDEVDDETDDEELDNETTTTETSSGGRRTVTRKKYDDMIFELDFPSRVVAGDPAEFRAQALDFDRTKLHQGEYIFNMGDGTVRTFAKNWHKDGSGFTHTYDYPGTYHISINYYLTRFDDTPPDVNDTFTIEVVPASVSLVGIRPDGAIEMKNTSSTAVDISGWRLTDSGGRVFIIPEASTILAGATIAYPQKVTRLSPFTGVTLATESGMIVTSSPVPKRSFVTSVSNAAVMKKSEPLAGEVLGASAEAATSQVAEISTPTSVVKKDPNSVVWVLLLIILVLVAVIAMLLLRKEERSNEYLLIEE